MQIYLYKKLTLRKLFFFLVICGRTFVSAPNQVWDGQGSAHTHYGTPFLKPKAYKARVEASLPNVGLSKFMRVGRRSILAHPKDKQYLIGFFDSFLSFGIMSIM